jgi:hypothetical protein
VGRQQQQQQDEDDVVDEAEGERRGLLSSSTSFPSSVGPAREVVQYRRLQERLRSKANQSRPPLWQRSQPDVATAAEANGGLSRAHAPFPMTPPPGRRWSVSEELAAEAEAGDLSTSVAVEAASVSAAAAISSTLATLPKITITTEDEGIPAGATSPHKECQAEKGLASNQRRHFSVGTSDNNRGTQKTSPVQKTTGASTKSSRSPPARHRSQEEDPKSILTLEEPSRVVGLHRSMQDLLPRANVLSGNPLARGHLVALGMAPPMAGRGNPNAPVNSGSQSSSPASTRRRSFLKFLWPRRSRQSSPNRHRDLLASLQNPQAAAATDGAITTTKAANASSRRRWDEYLNGFSRGRDLHGRSRLSQGSFRRVASAATAAARVTFFRWPRRHGAISWPR